MSYTRTGNRFYSQGREGFLKAEIDWLNDDICVALFNVYIGDGGYDDVAQRFASDIQDRFIEFKQTESSVEFVNFQSLSGKTATDGIADADDLTLYEVKPIQTEDDPDRAFEAVVIFKNTGDLETSPLICFIDTGIGLPFIPNAGHIKLNWSNGPNKIFKL